MADIDKIMLHVAITYLSQFCFSVEVAIALSALYETYILHVAAEALKKMHTGAKGGREPGDT